MPYGAKPELRKKTPAWDEIDERILAEAKALHDGGEPAKPGTIAKRLGATWITVEWRIWRMHYFGLWPYEEPTWHGPKGYGSEFKGKLYDHREAIITRYSSGESTTRLADDFGVAKQTIQRLLYRQGVVLRDSTKARMASELNESAFDSITEESAYWIGFLMADGCILDPPGRSPRVSIALAARDASHLEAFRRFLGSNHRIVETSNSSPTGKAGSRVIYTVSSKRIVDALGRYGVEPRKSLVARVVGLETNRDFWRGVIDGDGYIGSIAKYKSPLIGLVGSEGLVSQFRDFAISMSQGRTKALCRQENGALCRQRKGSNIYSFRATGVAAVMTIEALYANCSIALLRKLTLAKEIISIR